MANYEHNPKNPGDIIESKDWNAMGEKLQDISAKYDDAGDTIRDALSVKKLFTAEADAEVKGSQTVKGNQTLLGALSVGKNADVAGALSVDGVAKLDSTLTVKGNTSLGQTTINGSATATSLVSNSDLTVKRNAAVIGSLTARSIVSNVDLAVKRNGSIAGGLVVGGALTVGRNLGVNGNLSVTGEITGKLNALDVDEAFTATIRCADFRIGSQSRSKKLGRALVDYTNQLLINCGADWPEATVCSPLTVNGALKLANSDIYFTKTNHKYTGKGNAVGNAAIENDSGSYKALMILGRKVGTQRIVKLWDYLEVRGELEVTGDLKVKGKPVPTASAAVQVVAGFVNSAGNMVSGAGFTVKKAGKGLYDITFSPAFKERPAVVATQHYGGSSYKGGNVRDNATVTRIDAGRCRVKTGDGDGNASDRHFCFFAMGQR